MADEAPRITYYARVLDNITNEQVLDYMSANKNNTWYYGQCAKTGGESQYIVEFDIWNNEPAFNAGTAEYDCPNATNCKLTVWPTKDCKATVENDLFRLPTPFMEARCITNDYKADYTKIKFDTTGKMLTNITGNVNPSKIGTLHGNGDHTIIQTRINLEIPEGFVFDSNRYQFVFAFYYDF